MSTFLAFAVACGFAVAATVYAAYTPTTVIYRHGAFQVVVEKPATYEDAIELAQRSFEQLRAADPATLRFFVRDKWNGADALFLLPASFWKDGANALQSLKSGTVIEVDTPETAPATRRSAGSIYFDRRSGNWTGPRPVVPGPDVDSVTMYHA